MRVEPPYNPLDKKNLGISVADALLARPFDSLPPADRFIGAGVYAIYYKGAHPAYSTLAKLNKRDGMHIPIYVGKAIPSGARKGGYGLGSDPGQALYNRLRQHAKSIEQVSADIYDPLRLCLEDFSCQYLAVDDVWIPLGENLLIEMFSPVWNTVVDGFGNHDPGAGRYKGECSAWDVLHPGRLWAAKCSPSGKSHKEIMQIVKDHFANRYAQELED